MDVENKARTGTGSGNSVCHSQQGGGKKEKFLRQRERSGNKEEDNDIIAAICFKRNNLFCLLWKQRGSVLYLLLPLQAQTPTCPSYNADGKSPGQFVTNRCLRGFINMSGIDTIFESVRVCARKHQTTWKTAHNLISTHAYFPRDDRTAVSRICGAKMFKG